LYSTQNIGFLLSASGEPGALGFKLLTVW